MTPSKTVKTDPRLVLQQALLAGDNPDDTLHGGVDSLEALNHLQTALAALHVAHGRLARIARGATEARFPALAAALHEAVARDLIQAHNQLATSDLLAALVAYTADPADEGEA